MKKAFCPSFAFKSSLWKIFGSALLVASCASSIPPQGVKEFPEGTDVNAEISKTGSDINVAGDAQVDVLAPKSYSEARAAFEKAQKERTEKSSADVVLKDLARAQGWLENANKKSEIIRTTDSKLMATRKNALAAGAATVVPVEFAKADKELTDLTADAEKGDIKGLDKALNDLTNTYGNLEVKSVTKTKLGHANDLILEAEKQGAKENAPKTLAATQSLYNETAAIIKKSPRDTVAIEPHVVATTQEAEKLLRVTHATKAAGGSKSEDLVLQNETQKSNIKRLGKETAAVLGEVNELQQTQEFQDKVATIRSKFSDSEAEVLQDGNKVVIRLRSIAFPSNQAVLPTASYSSLKKVQESITLLGGGNERVVIEGHTDSTGTRKKNQTLSQKRADAVREYLSANLELDSTRLESVGMGFEKPLTDNKTEKSRALNRRVDIVIDPASKSSVNL